MSNEEEQPDVLNIDETSYLMQALGPDVELPTPGAPSLSFGDNIAQNVREGGPCLFACLELACLLLVAVSLNHRLHAETLYMLSIALAVPAVVMLSSILCMLVVEPWADAVWSSSLLGVDVFNRKEEIYMPGQGLRKRRFFPMVVLEICYVLTVTAPLLGICAQVLRTFPVTGIYVNTMGPILGLAITVIKLLSFPSYLCRHFSVADLELMLFLPFLLLHPFWMFALVYYLQKDSTTGLIILVFWLGFSALVLCLSSHKTQPLLNKCVCGPCILFLANNLSYCLMYFLPYLFYPFWAGWIILRKRCRRRSARVAASSYSNHNNEH